MLFVGNPKDPITDSVLAVMKENAIRRAVQAEFNKELAIQNPKQIPHELVQEYNSLLKKRTDAALNEHCIDSNAIDKDKNYKEDETTETEKGDNNRTSRDQLKKLIAAKKKLRNEEFSLSQAKASWGKRMSRHQLINSPAENAKRKANKEKDQDVKSAENDWNGAEKAKEGFAQKMKRHGILGTSAENAKKKENAQKAQDAKGVKKVKAGFEKAMSEENIQELSQNLIKKYTGKAKESITDLRKKRLAALGKGDSAEHGKLYDKSRQRMNTLAKAEKKVNEENINELLRPEMKPEVKPAAITPPVTSRFSHSPVDAPPTSSFNKLGDVPAHSAAPALGAQFDIKDRLKAAVKHEPDYHFDPKTTNLPVKKAPEHEPNYYKSDDKPATRSIAPPVKSEPVKSLEHPVSKPIKIGKSKPEVRGFTKPDIANKVADTEVKPDADIPTPRQRPPDPSDDDSFNTAYGKARAQKRDIFQWKGKSYNTKFKLRK